FADPSIPFAYTLSLHDALPICTQGRVLIPGALPIVVEPQVPDSGLVRHRDPVVDRVPGEHRSALARRGTAGEDQQGAGHRPGARSEEHTSELQSRENLVCRLLL